MIKTSAPKEDPAVTAAKQAEMARAENANLNALRDMLLGRTAAYRRAFGRLTNAAGGQGSGLGALVTAANLGSGATGGGGSSGGGGSLAGGTVYRGISLAGGRELV